MELQEYLDKRNGVCSLKTIPFSWKFPLAAWISLENEYFILQKLFLLDENKVKECSPYPGTYRTVTI